MNTAGYEWAARVRALNEIEVAKANAERVPLSAGNVGGQRSDVRQRKDESEK